MRTNREIKMKLTIFLCLCTFAAGKIYFSILRGGSRISGRGGGGFRCVEEGVRFANFI